MTENTKTVIIGSLQYSPVYKSHCVGLGNQCMNNGFDVHYLFSNHYEWMLSPENKERSTFIGQSRDLFSSVQDSFDLRNYLSIRRCVKDIDPDYIYMYNIHPFLNVFVGSLTSELPVDFIQHIHEPFAEDKQQFGKFKSYWLHIFEYIQSKIVGHSNKVVLSSDRAEKAFKQHYNFDGDILRIPLLYEDTHSNRGKSRKRKYITYIGPPVPAKSPELFLRLAEYSHRKGEDYKFVVVSNSEITDDRFLDKPNIVIYHDEKIPDEEINMILGNSIATITPFTTANQSSTVLTSYMNGTPVVSSNVGGLTEFISHKKTGYLLNLQDPISDWLEGIKFVEKNQTTMSKNCRREFVNKYSEENWQKYMGVLFS